MSLRRKAGAAMSFFRPEASRLVLRWLETMLFGGATLAALCWIAFDPGWSGVARSIVGGAVALIGLWLTRSAALSALARAAEVAPGVVDIRERRIAYFGPEGGGVASLDDIHTIEIWGPEPDVWRHETEWVFRWSDEEPALTVPAGAKGAEALIDACAALPGFAPARALSALGAKAGARTTIWRRGSATHPGALAPPAPHARSTGN